ncbi:hypothetical protein SELMODRAFT_421400 [Selaginella moellendorffii]|uniref:RRM domain-containing protein n=1 Tax=Selaginella moellendorffii TaxID=88036 RepID=D8SF58_SELML|nr:hypothetical protein SELMODRAFT_421400 [Selaginella moellendorffii]
MPGGNVDATLYVSNLDDRVDERVLYDIMVQAGPLVEVYIPRDKETKRHRGYGFAEYESEESASYALRLFSGLVTLHNRPVNFAFSGGAKKVPQQQQQQQQSSLFDPTLDQTPPSSKFERFLSASSSSDRDPKVIMESSSSFIVLNSSDEPGLFVFNTNKEEWSEWPMCHTHNQSELSCPCSRLLCFTNGSGIHVHHTQTNQREELANITGCIREGYFNIWHCSLSPDNQSLEQVVYNEAKREVILYDSGDGALEAHKSKLDSKELELLSDVCLDRNNNKAYLLYCCGELATYDLESHELSFYKLEILESYVSDASLDLNTSVVACKNNAFMVGYLLVECDEYDHVGIWKLDMEGKRWELVSKVPHSDGYVEDEEGNGSYDEDVIAYRITRCCSNGVDKIWIAIDKCEFMWMYSVDADTWRKLPSYSQAKKA